MNTDAIDELRSDIIDKLESCLKTIYTEVNFLVELTRN